mmetsp:Transcript_89662/g.208865  ORF Transcript_89662/g.208865 Transcript_89662/m.208865 type:complete len:315 (+) Transcript_89662:344-1288(+)
MATAPRGLVGVRPDTGEVLRHAAAIRAPRVQSSDFPVARQLRFHQTPETLNEVLRWPAVVLKDHGQRQAVGQNLRLCLEVSRSATQSASHAPHVVLGPVRYRLSMGEVESVGHPAVLLGSLHGHLVSHVHARNVLSPYAQILQPFGDLVPAVFVREETKHVNGHVVPEPFTRLAALLVGPMPCPALLGIITELGVLQGIEGLHRPRRSVSPSSSHILQERPTSVRLEVGVAAVLHCNPTPVPGSKVTLAILDLTGPLPARTQVPQPRRSRPRNQSSDVADVRPPPRRGWPWGRQGRGLGRHGRQELRTAKAKQR